MDVGTDANYSAGMTELLKQAIADERNRERPKRTIDVGLRLDDETHEALKAVVGREGVSLNGVVVAILRRALGMESR